MPSVSGTINLNPDPRFESRRNLANKFNEIRLNNIAKILGGAFQLSEIQLNFEEVIRNIASKKSDVEVKNIKIKELISPDGKEIKHYLYSNLFNPENNPESPINVYSKLPYNTILLAEAIDFLSVTKYNDLEIIVDGNINPDILLILKNKFNTNTRFSKLEGIIADVAILKGGSTIESSEGKVNSESLSNENSHEKAEQNLRRLKVLSESMSGISELQPGAEVPMRLMPEGTQYKKGDIIVFYRDGLKIVHRVEFVYTSNGETFYVTEGLNTETNPLVDNSPVSGDDVIGIVDLSEEAFLAIEEILEHGYLPSIEAFGMPSPIDSFRIYMSDLKFSEYFKRAQEAVNSFSNGLTPQSLNNREVRLWYMKQETKIKHLLDSRLPLKLQALQAFFLRNCLRTKARELMKDQTLANYLKRTERNYSWDELVDDYRREGYSGKALWEAIIESSMKSRSSANKFLGVSEWMVYPRWWKYYKVI
jgi:hypothetical protein